MKKKLSVGKILTQVFLVIWLFICLFPLYWMFTMSLKDTNEIFGGNMVGLPTQWLWGNYASAWGSGGKVSMYLLNSVIDTFSTLLLTSTLGFMSAYGLLRMRWKGQKVVFTYILMGMMIPMHAALYPLTEILLSLTKTNWALIIPYTAFNIPITILILSGFMSNIPYEMEEAACIDGSNARRGQHHPFLLGVLGNVAQKCGLTRARLSRQEERTTRIVHYLQGILPLLVL